MSLFKKLPLAAVAALAVALAACTTAPPAQRSGDAALEQRAQAAVERGDDAAAAELYRELAESAAGRTRVAHLLEAARLAIAAGDTASAAEWLDEAEPEADDEQRNLARVLRAELDLRANRPEAALDRLDTLTEPLAIALMTDAESVRGRALFRLGRTVEAVRVLAERETWLESGPEILDNQRLIWDALAESDFRSLNPTGDDVVDGWLALAPLAASEAEGDELRRALLDWRQEYARHPAAGALLADLLDVGRGLEAYPAEVALLLPITSPQRNAALALRDGFLAAHFRARAEGAPGGDAAIRVYDTGLLGAQEAYLQAQLEGADFIVGPLLRPEVEEVADQAGFVPTLALNFIETETGPFSGFYQFALSPEDEARAVARRAYADGARTALGLVASTDWGYRLLNAFRNEFEALGGQFLGFNGYDPSAQDFSAPITSLLNLDRSEQRHTRLAANLDVPLEFEPRRRRDVDMLFLAVPNRGVGHLLAPALRFHFAGDIPTFATSDIHEPADAARDGDLNSIYFPDAPWLLNPDSDDAALRGALERYWPRRARSSAIRLYGMGIDAYRLVGRLYGGSGEWPVHGLSGDLELADTGRIHRRLPFAQFRDGRPVAVEPIELPAPPAFPAAGEELADSR